MCNVKGLEIESTLLNNANNAIEQDPVQLSVVFQHSYSNLLGRELIHISGEANKASGRDGGCMEGPGRGTGGMSTRGVGCISTSKGSCLGQILTGSSFGQTSFEGGQLGGCMEVSEPIGDHKIRGDGLVPDWRKTGESTRCFKIQKQGQHRRSRRGDKWKTTDCKAADWFPFLKSNSVVMS